MRALRLCALLVVCGWFISSAHADDAAVSTLLPPELEQFSEAVLADGVTPTAGSTGLVLSIDETGHVTDSVIEVSLSPELDAAAAAAARRFVFKPATRAGKPIASRVRYQYLFAAPPVPEPVAAITTGSISGQITALDDKTVIVGADMTLTSKSGDVRSATSDTAGRFVFADLPEGDYTLNIAALTLEAVMLQEHVTAGEALDVHYRLKPVNTGASETFSASARIEAPSREIVRRSIAPEELVRMAGTRGDPLRTVELLPGVARPPSGQGMLIVRGSSPGDSEVFLDGAPIYGLYHFGGLTSVVNGYLLKGIDLYPGNFSVRFGRKTGAVIETNFRDPRSDRVHGIVDVNVIDASLLVEAPITDQLSFAVAARRSYMDTWFKALAQSTDLNVSAAPVYYDYQGILSWRPSNHDRVRLIGYGSFDTLKLVLNTADQRDPAIRGKIGNTNSFHRAQLEWHRDFNQKLDSDFSVGAGPVLTKATIGPELGYEVRGFDVISRAEMHWRMLSRLRLNTGVDAQILQTHLAYHGPQALQDEGDPSSEGPIAGRDATSVDTTRTYVRPAGYAELVAQVTERLEVTAGTRVDYFGDIHSVTVDPRLNTRLKLGATTLRAGVGSFSQPPDITQTVRGYGNPKLKPFHALHVGAGVEQRLSELATVSADGFYKHLTDVIVNRPDGEGLENRGEGHIYGMELMGRLNPGGRFSGFFSYTLSRSERNDRDGTGSRLFDYDQTHILTTSSNVKLGRGIVLGATFRLASGNPYTPITRGLYNANLDTYDALYGATNSARSKYFHRLDVRIEKRWELGTKGSGIVAYLDVQNAYNRQNPEGAQYNFDYSRTKTVSGLPIIPSIGLRGEL